jgi:hypothetical protein
MKVYVTFSGGEKVTKNPPEPTASGPPFDSSRVLECVTPSWSADWLLRVGFRSRPL